MRVRTPRFESSLKRCRCAVPSLYRSRDQTVLLAFFCEVPLQYPGTRMDLDILKEMFPTIVMDSPPSSPAPLDFDPQENSDAETEMVTESSVDESGEEDVSRPLDKEHLEDPQDMNTTSPSSDGGAMQEDTEAPGEPARDGIESLRRLYRQIEEDVARPRSQLIERWREAFPEDENLE